MARFEGPQPGYKDPNTRTKGVMRRLREIKREEAEARNREYQKRLAAMTISPEGLSELENEIFTVKMPHLEAPCRVA